MKPRVLVLCSTLTAVALLPGLLDAQFRPCPACMQVQTYHVQWQNTYRYQQQQIQMQQMQVARIQAQQQQIRMQAQQMQTIQGGPTKVAMTQNAIKASQAKVMQPVGGQINRYGQQVITKSSVLIPRTYGTVPGTVTPIITTQRHVINTMSQVNRIGMIPSTVGKVTSQKHTIAYEKPAVIAPNTSAMKVVGGTTKIQTQQAKINTQQAKVTGGCAKVGGSETITIVKWRTDCWTCHKGPQTQDPLLARGPKTPMPEMIGRKAPSTPQMVKNPTPAKLPEMFTKAKTPVKEPVADVVRASKTPVRELFRPGQPSLQQPIRGAQQRLPEIIGPSRVPQTTLVGSSPGQMPMFFDRPMLPTLIARNGSPSTKKMSPGEEPLTLPGTTTPPALVEGITTPPVARALPPEALEIPMLPETREMIRGSSAVAGLHDLLNERHAEAAREEPAPLEMARPRLSDADLQAPSLPPLPESILVLPPESQDIQGEELPPFPSEGTELVELIPSAPPRGEPSAAAPQTRPSPTPAPAAEATTVESLSMPSLPRSGREPG